MIKKFFDLPIWTRLTLFFVFLIFIGVSTYLTFYSLNGGQSANPSSSAKEDIVGSSTSSPNNPISDTKGNTKKDAGKEVTKNTTPIQTSPKVGQTAPKIPYYRASIPYWDQGAAFASFEKNANLFNFVTVFWYTLRRDGSIRKYTYAVEDAQIINFAHTNSVKVFGLIANLPDEDEGGSWDSERIDKVISTKSARSSHIADIVSLTQRMGFDGISIDYEELETYQKDSFTLFIKELASALHEKGKLLGVAIHPKSGEGKPQENNGSAAQDLVPISQAGDQLYFMTYGEHWDDSVAGPIASVSWVKNVINYAISIGVPREKIFMGVPLYGLDWPKNGSSYGTAKGLTYSEVAGLINQYKPTLIVDTAEGSAHFTYESSGQSHEVWFENYQTVLPKLEFAKSLGISATFWRLGGEDPLVWTTAAQFH